MKSEIPPRCQNWNPTSNFFDSSSSPCFTIFGQRQGPISSAFFRRFHEWKSAFYFTLNSEKNKVGMLIMGFGSTKFIQGCFCKSTWQVSFLGHGLIENLPYFVSCNVPNKWLPWTTNITFCSSYCQKREKISIRAGPFKNYVDKILEILLGAGNFKKFRLVFSRNNILKKVSLIRLLGGFLIF